MFAYYGRLHVGPRSRNNLGYHHPSVVNGPNHMLNRLAISAAQDVGMPVIDLTELTSQKQPTTKEDGAHRSMTPDGDPYHDGTTGIRIRSLGRSSCGKCARSAPRRMECVHDAHRRPQHAAFQNWLSIIFSVDYMRQT